MIEDEFFYDREIFEKVIKLKSEMTDKEIVSLLESDILELGSPYISYMFSRYIEGANIKEHEKVLFKYKNVQLIVEWALHINGADINSCEKIVLENNNKNSILKFAEVNGADIKKIETAIIKFNDPSTSYKFARDINGANIKAHEKIVAQDPYYSYLFASNIKDADIKFLEQVVAQSNDADLCTTFFKNVKGADVKVLEQGAIKSNSTLGLYRFMNNVKGIDKKAFKKRIQELEENYKEIRKKANLKIDFEKNIDKLLTKKKTK